MKRALCTLIAVAMTTTATLPLAAQEFPPAPAIGTPKPFAVPASETFELANGMKVTLIPYGVAPKTVVSLRVYAGNLNEGPNPWVADLTGDLMKEGAGGKTSAQLATAAAAMGGDLGVGVSQQMTTIGIGVLSEHAADAVALVADVARNPALPASEFDRVKANWGRRLTQLLSQPGALADYALARAYYGDHPYGRMAPTAAQLSGYTVEDVKAFYAAQFGAKRAHLYIAGRFDAAAVKTAVEKAFGGWAAGPERLSLVPVPKPGPRVILVDRPGAPQSTLRIAFPVPLAGSTDDMTMRVANALLGGAFSSRITTNIRENKGYTYSPGSGSVFNPGDAQWTFDADVTSAVTGASLKEVFGEIRRLQTEIPPDAEAAGMKTYVAGLFVIQNSSAGALINSLATRNSLGLPANWMDTYVPAALAVTPAQMSAVMAGALPLDKMTLVVVGDMKTVKPQLEALPELKGLPTETVTVP